MGLAIEVSRLPLSKVRRRCQWKGLYDDVAEFVKSREECERYDRNRYEEPLKPTWMTIVWAKDRCGCCLYATCTWRFGIYCICSR